MWRRLSSFKSFGAVEAELNGRLGRLVRLVRLGIQGLGAWTTHVSTSAPEWRRLQHLVSGLPLISLRACS